MQISLSSTDGSLYMANYCMRHNTDTVHEGGHILLGDVTFDNAISQFLLFDLGESIFI